MAAVTVGWARLESGGPEELSGVPGEVAASRERSPEGLEEMLGVAYGPVGRGVLDVQETTGGLQDPRELHEGAVDVGDGAQDEGAHDGVEVVVGEGEVLGAGAVQGDGDGARGGAGLGPGEHVGIRVHGVDARHRGGVVAAEVQARAHAYLEDGARGFGNDPVAQRLVGSHRPVEEGGDHGMTVGVAHGMT